MKDKRTIARYRYQNEEREIKDEKSRCRIFGMR